ncbi:hypothetical protein [Flavobacterium piscisymbiosum]|uniref:NERD domain-containing protein n=1 Tax=Flavobacterium piscisymbiosum TaxID=2893753 RepID=A0ABS8MGL7_9FLAO|nr:hypothetical protein [Flavobacterium sp. F-30]MCC9064632.1 hypothetical protein [Flavobacterium sp. F-30]
MSKRKKRPISKKKKLTKDKPLPYQVIEQKFVQFKNPIFQNVAFEKRTEFIIELGNKASIEFESNYLKLIDYFKEYDPLYLCSFSSYYFNRLEEGIDQEAINGFLDFHCFYLEILQSLSLKMARNISGKPLHENIKDFKSTIQNLNHNQSFSYLKLLEKAKDQDDIGAIILRTEMMNHTLAIRNWAYINQMQTIAYELANLIEDKFIKSQGFKPSVFLDILFGLVSITEAKLNLHHQKTISFVKARNYNEVFDKYEESFTNVNSVLKTDREKVWTMVGKNLKNLKGMLLEHSDYFLSDIFTHSSSEICEILEKTNQTEICNILDKLSYSFGDLSEVNKDFIFLDNPIHSKPFIKIKDESYYSVIPHMFSHLGMDLLEKFIFTDTTLLKDYTVKKGKYLEDKVENLFKQSFPSAEVLSGSLWKCSNLEKDFENDLIVLIEDFAIIIECKSGTVSPPARRGATDRLFKTLKELVIEPSEQAIRFENYLKENKKLHEFTTKTNSINRIDSAKIKYYIPIGITLSNLGSIGCNLKKLIDAKVISHKLNELAPSISFTDLEIIFELLPLEAEKIHYLSRRREFEAHLKFQGDEMDLFGFYLDNGFNIGETEYDDSNHIDMTLKSKEIDPYIIGKHRGINVKKPFLKKTKYCDDILKKLSQKSNNWLMASYILLNLPEDDQIKYETNLKRLTKMIIDGKCIKKHNWMEMVCGPKRRRYVIVGFPYKNIDIETRNAILNDITVSLDKRKLRGFLILGYNLNSNEYPYSVLAGSFKTNFFDDLELN